MDLCITISTIIELLLSLVELTRRTKLARRIWEVWEWSCCKLACEALEWSGLLLSIHEHGISKELSVNVEMKMKRTLYCFKMSMDPVYASH